MSGVMERREAVQAVVDELSAPAASMFLVAELSNVAMVMLDELAKG